MNHVVLLKSRSGNHGGLEKYAARIAQAFIQKGARVTMLSSGKVPPRSPIPIFSTKTVPWPAFVRMEQFDQFVQNWIKKNGADIIFGMDRNRHQTHIRAGNGVHAAYLESRLLTEGKLKSLICYFNPMHRKILELEKAAFENPMLQKLFTNSFMVRDQILRHYRTDPNKISVIHNGVEWHEMENDFSNWEEKRAEGLKKFNLNKNHFHFLFIGNGYLRKGLDRLLEGLSRLNERDLHLSVIGKDNQIDLYRAKTVQYGLHDKVRFFGPRDDIRLFYQMADALVIPSFYDPFANVTVEALAMGLFVVSSKQNGGHEILNRDNGIVIEDLLDPDAMVQALRSTLKFRKTANSAHSARQSVKYLDFAHQLKRITDEAYLG